MVHKRGALPLPHTKSVSSGVGLEKSGAMVVPAGQEEEHDVKSNSDLL
jgi:hypothetical protein